MCGDKPWNQADRKAVSMLYVCLETEGRRIVCSRNPHLKLDTLILVELWRITEEAFLRPRIIIFDRYMLLSTKQSKGESIEHIFVKLLTENCELENQENTLIVELLLPTCPILKFRNSYKKKLSIMLRHYVWQFIWQLVSRSN